MEDNCMPRPILEPGASHFTAKAKRPLRGLFPAASFFLLLGLAAAGLLRAGEATGDAKGPDSGSHGVDVSIFDKTCKPCEDFYHYASGDWVTKNPVPAAYPSWGRFNELAERNRDLLRQILESAAANVKATPGSNEQKIGDFYASC